ncbi:hypothetical protein HYU22_02890 [Candidatus Woesearchaeota archaeon]|nr:hypothetical protein [Candidatus Woesearchaeota archaeon]
MEDKLLRLGAADSIEARIRALDKYPSGVVLSLAQITTRYFEIVLGMD